MSRTENADSSEQVLEPSFKGKKLICRVWDNPKDPYCMAKKKVTYGSPYFKAKIGGKDRLYKINYNTEGCIKQDGKQLIYDTTFKNTTGALRFFEYPEDMDSEEAYTALENNAVNMYVKKGGIPMWYLLIAFAVAGVGFVALIAIVPSALQAQDEVKQLDLQVTQLKKDNAVLSAQLASQGGING